MTERSSQSPLPVGWQRSFDELGTPLIDTTFCVLDLETTGTNRHEDQITEIGAVKVRGGQTLGTYQTLVHPGCAIPPRITILTGLTDALVATAPRIEQVLPSLIEFLGDAVLVAHNVAFDLGFLRAAFERSGRGSFDPVRVDTVALARRLVRDEVPNCRLSTLADRLRLAHRPSHRALDDALATAELLHVLLERAAGWGVLGLDDLIALAKIGGHPQAGKLRLTADLPRAPGVYVFRDHRGEPLYVGKATNLRQRVRGYFGSEDRRKVGPMLRETHHIDHLELPDPLTAAVVEQRLIAQTRPRYNRTGTRADRYCFVRLDLDAPWPRLSIVREIRTGAVHLGPLPSRAMATAVIDAIHTVLPLRRCSTRLGARYEPPPHATPCAAAQLGVAACPCAGRADPQIYRHAVERAAAALTGDDTSVAEHLDAKMTALAIQQRFEEAALVRDRLTALLTAQRRHHLVETLRRAGRVRVGEGAVSWTIESGQLLYSGLRDHPVRAVPIAPPDPPDPTTPFRADQIDEALCLARHLDRHADRLEVLECSGTWGFPVDQRDRPDRLEIARTCAGIGGDQPGPTGSASSSVNAGSSDSMRNPTRSTSSARS